MRLCNTAGVAVLCFTVGIHSFSVRSGITRGVIHENIVKPSKKSFTSNKHCRSRQARLFSSISTPEESSENYVTTDADTQQKNESFDLTTALFCGGLAFDAYSEPSDSSRWEKGPQGTNVAFQSNAYTRSLYNGKLLYLKSSEDILTYAPEFTFKRGFSHVPFKNILVQVFLKFNHYVQLTYQMKTVLQKV